MEECPLMKKKKKLLILKFKLSLQKLSPSPQTDTTYTPKKVPVNVNAAGYQMLGVPLVTTYRLKKQQTFALTTTKQSPQGNAKRSNKCYVNLLHTPNALACVITQWRHTSDVALNFGNVDMSSRHFFLKSSIHCNTFLISMYEHSQSTLS